MNCIFCEAPGTSGEVVLDDPAALVIVHPDWATRGHLMVVSKIHVENLSELSEEELLRFTRLYRTAERAALQLTGSDRAIVMKLGIAVPHLHLHIYPVSSALDREAVMQIVDAKVHDLSDDQVRRALVERLRELLAAPSRSV